MAAEADACAKDMTATLRGRLQGNAGDAAESIQLMRQLGEPIENLQVLALCAKLTCSRYSHCSSASFGRAVSCRCL